MEVEVGRFRDQQYEMLKRWRQQQHAGLGARLRCPGAAWGWTAAQRPAERHSAAP